MQHKKQSGFPSPYSDHLNGKKVVSWKSRDGAMSDELLLETQGMQQATGRAAYVHTLGVRLTDQEYRNLRRFVARQEERLGRRLTHQAVLEAALHQFLERQQEPKPR